MHTWRGADLSLRAFPEHRTHNCENKTDDSIWKTTWEEATWKCLVNCRHGLKPQWRWLNIAGILVGRTDDQKNTKDRFHQFSYFTNAWLYFLPSISWYNWGFSPWRKAERFLQMFSLWQMEQKLSSITRKMDRCITFATIKMQQRLKASHG